MITLFLFAGRITHSYPAFFASLFLTLNPYVIDQTRIGFFDKQSVSLFFLILIPLLILVIIKKLIEKKWIPSAFLGIAVIACLWFFSILWSGYFMIYALLAGTVVIYAIYRGVEKHVPEKKRMIVFTLLWFFPLLLFLMFQTSVIEKAPDIIKTYLKADNMGSYPNPFESIEELQPLTFTQLISLSGGKITFLFIIAGIWLFYVNIFAKQVQENNKQNIHGTLFILFWLIVLGYLSFRTKRFLLFFLVPVSFFLGYGIYRILAFIQKASVDVLPAKYPSTYVGFVGFLVLSIVLLFMPPAFAFSEQYEHQKSLLPIVDDAFYQVALILKEHSSEHAKINVWWDKGHAVKALTEREPFFAGAPQMPGLYWAAKSLTTTDEVKAKNINQFLSCGLWNVYDFASLAYFQSNVNLTFDEVDTFLRIPTEQEQKVFLAKRGVYSNFSNKLFSSSLLNCNFEIYILITEDQRLIFNTISHIANWDTKAAEAKKSIEGLGYAQALAALENEGKTKKEAQELYNKILQLDTIKDLGLRRTQCPYDQERIQCIIREEYPFLVNRTTGEVLSEKKPKKVFIAENDAVIEYNYETYDYNNTLLMYNTDGPMFGFLIPNEVADSMFMRMLFLEGKGLEHFEQIADVHNFGTKRTVVYKVENEISNII